MSQKYNLVIVGTGEIIHEWIVILHRNIKAGNLSNEIHVYPSYSVAGKQAAAETRIDRVLSGISSRVVHGLAHRMH